MLRLTCTAILGLSLLAGVSSAQAADDPVKLIYNTYLPKHDPMRRTSIDDFSRRIEKESGGSIEITIPGSSLTKPDGQLSAVKDRIIDMAMISVYASRAQTGLPLLGDMPFNSLSGESASVAIWETQQKYFDKVNEFNDVKLLSMHVLPGVNFVGREQPIRSMADFDGKKIWATAGKQTDALETVGAVPVHSYFPQLFEYVSKGTVDGAMIGTGTILAASLGDHVKAMTRFPGGMGSATWAVVMNQDAWNELNAEQQAAVLRAADGLPRRTGIAMDERKDRALKELNLDIVDADPAFVDKLRHALAPMKQAWIADAQKRHLDDAANAFEFYRSRMEDIYAGQLKAANTTAQATMDEAE
ncbi:TRAP transporter substrate-binding protein DctP [Marinobacter bohaiensis]|uniref:TRAP transporter substrate-binding protein DctP n=1 Tax=Marinobacter bohaiensis TaxID=2201898 RepID=UPI0013A6EEFC|nr:TRAP transporter substrate-binding protein DctP [Marinobacter bohaiensis]